MREPTSTRKRDTVTVSVMNSLHAFEHALLVSTTEVEILISGHPLVPWENFLLNPRRLRGSDFLMRWSQGVWSEERLVEAVNATAQFYALPYGPSSVAPDNDVRAFELYFERLETAGLGAIKRPDLLIIRRADLDKVQTIVGAFGGVTELPFVSEENPDMQELLSYAILAVECENSLWKAQQMPAYGAQLKPMKRLGGRLGLAGNAVLPTVIIKEEDVAPLRAWQEGHGVPIHVWHVFYDMAFGIAFDKALSLVQQGLILPTEQVFQAPGGATTKKAIYKIYYHYAYPIGISTEEPRLIPAVIIDRNGHILPYVHFEGGSLQLTDEVMEVLKEAANE